MTTNLLSQIADELSGVLDRPVAEKLAQVLVATYERLHESVVLQRLDALETAMRRSHEELARRVEEQLAAHRRETDERFRELREEQQRMYAEFTEFRKETDRRFVELREEVAELRKQTDERFRELREEQQRMYAEFTEFRRETDRRFLELREEFTEFRKETDRQFLELREEFTEFRKETDRRFLELREEVAELRRETDERFRELAETVRLTQEALRDLALVVKDLQKQVGGLSQTVGYVLENEAMKALPDLLLRDYGLRVEGRLKRGYVKDGAGRPIEVNIFGTALRDGEQVTIVGESKAQLSKNDIDRFLRRTVEVLREVYSNILPIVVTHITSEPDAEEYARSLGVAVYYSYEF